MAPSCKLQDFEYLDQQKAPSDKRQAASWLDKVTIYDYMGDMKRKIRSKHNDLMNYFIHNKRDLSSAYVKKCESFLWTLRNAGLITKQAANTLYRLQASSRKRPKKNTNPWEDAIRKL